jgi:hypothetical protein
MFVNKVLGRARPGWQQNIMNPLTTVWCTEVVVVQVRKEFWEVEKFRDQFFDVTSVVVNRVPGSDEGVELSVRDIEASALQFDVKRGERLHTDEVV